MFVSTPSFFHPFGFPLGGGFPVGFGDGDQQQFRSPYGYYPSQGVR